MKKIVIMSLALTLVTGLVAQTTTDDFGYRLAMQIAASPVAELSSVIPVIDWSKVKSNQLDNIGVVKSITANDKILQISQWIGAFGAFGTDTKSAAISSSGNANLDATFKKIDNAIGSIANAINTFGFNANVASTGKSIDITSFVKDTLTAYALVQGLLVDAIAKKAPLAVQTALSNLFNRFATALNIEAQNLASYFADKTKVDTALQLYLSLLLPSILGAHTRLTSTKSTVLTLDPTIGTKVIELWVAKVAFTTTAANDAWFSAINGALLNLIGLEARELVG